MNSDKMIEANLMKLFTWYSSNDCFSSGFSIPEPISGQHEELIDDIMVRVNTTMPLQSVIIDLWDQDIHFEKELETQWYFDAAFGSQACLDWCVTELATFVLSNHARYGMPLIDTDQPDFGGEEFVTEESRAFVTGWREGLLKKYAEVLAAKD